MKRDSRTLEDEQVVREHPQHELALLGRRAARGQRVAEEPLVLREAALRLLPLAVEGVRERLAHRPPVGLLGPLPPEPTAIELDRRPGETQRLATEAVTVLGIVAPIGHGGREGQHLARLAERRGQGGDVVRGNAPQDRARNQVRGRVDDGRQLTPVSLGQTRRVWRWRAPRGAWPSLRAA